MQYKIVKVNGLDGYVIVYYTVIGGKTQVVEVSERYAEHHPDYLNELAKSRVAILEDAYIAARAPTT